MKPVHRPGFALILVIITLFMASIIMLVVAADARTLRFQADRLQVQALAENLHASARAWAWKELRHHQGNQAESSKTTPTEVELNIGSLTDRPATLTIHTNDTMPDQVAATFFITCSYGRQRYSRSHEYVLRATHKMGVAPRSSVSSSGKEDEAGLPRKVDAI